MSTKGLKKSLLLAFLLMFTTSYILTAATIDFNSVPGMSTSTEVISLNGKTYTFSVLWVDTSDEKIRIETGLPGSKIGQTTSLSSLMNASNDLDGHVYAAISGGNYDYKDDKQPDGTLIVDKEVKHIGNSGSLFTYDKSGLINFYDADITLNITTKPGSAEEATFATTLINHYVDNPASPLYFTSDYSGPKPAHNMYSIQCSNGIVSTISKGDFDIPTEGFTLLIPDSISIEHFEISDSITTDFSYRINNQDTNIFENIRTGLGAGPLLVKNSIKQANLSTSGIGSYHSDSSATTRGLIGTDKNGLLGMATIENVTLNDLADIALELEMVQAMQLNFGPTSTLNVNGTNTVSTDIGVSSALLVKRLNNSPIKVTLNGNPIFFDTEPYINSSFGRTLVPLRKIAEALGAEVGWDQETQSVLINRYDTLLKLQLNSTTVYVNGLPTTMELPMTIRNSRSYVPVRFITEYFGGQVGWDAQTKTVLLTISTLDGLFNSAEKYLAEGKKADAMEKYLEILELEPTNLIATKALAAYYTESTNNLTTIETWNQKVLALEPNDKDALSSLAWAYADVGLVDQAIEWFTTYLTHNSTDAYHHYGIALQYSSFQKNNTSKAKEHFQLAVNYGLDGTKLDFANNYIENH